MSTTSPPGLNPDYYWWLHRNPAGCARLWTRMICCPTYKIKCYLPRLGVKPRVSRLPVVRLTPRPMRHLILLRSTTLIKPATFGTFLPSVLGSVYVSWVGINLDDNTFCRALWMACKAFLWQHTFEIGSNLKVGGLLGIFKKGMYHIKNYLLCMICIERELENGMLLLI